jgi:ADP-ribose pyrophosphatase YjhB (NUDIX family)
MSSPDPTREPEQGPTASPATASAQGPQGNAESDSTGSAGSAAKRRRRRRSRRGRKPAAKVETGQDGNQPAAPAEPEAVEGTAKPKKRRRRGRRSRSGAATVEAVPDTGPDAAAVAPAPRKKRRRRGSGSGAGAGSAEEQPALIRGRRRTRSGRIEEVSAGGLVVDATGDVVRGVLIGKHDRKGRLVWSLPKGHVETGETLEQTAVREIEEETGVTAEVRHKLGEVDYWFMLHGEKIHKTVHHFLLRFVSGELCDRDVEVAEVAWVPLAEIPAKLAYPDERRLVAQVPELLPRAM